MGGSRGWNENGAAIMVQRVWRGRQARDTIGRAMNLLPICIIPAIAGSGLQIEESSISPSYKGERVWMNAGMLAASRVIRKDYNKREDDDDDESGYDREIDGVEEDDDDDDGDDEEVFVKKEKALQVQSAWLHHISLSDDMVTEREGNKVRPYDGLDGVEYMTGSAITQVGSWVHAPVVKYLMKELGYKRGQNIDGAPYDWRVPPNVTEKRDGYLTKTKEKIEWLFEKNFRRPVVLLCHSMGCKMGHYFLTFCKEKYGQDWLDKYIYSYMPVGAPHCGVSIAVRSALTGKGLSPEVDMLMASDSEGLILYRSWGSGGWLMPRTLPDHVLPSVIRRREAELAIALAGPIQFGTLFADRKKPPSELRLVIKIAASDEIVATSSYCQVESDATELDLKECFYIALPDKCKSDGNLCDLSFVLEEPAGHLQSSSEIRKKVSKLTSWGPLRHAKKGFTRMSREIAKVIGAGTGAAISDRTYHLHPSDFENEEGIMTLEVQLKHPRKLLHHGSGSCTIKLKHKRAESVVGESAILNETPTPIGAINDPTHQIPISHKRRDCVKYQAMSGHQLLGMEGFIKIDQVIKDHYEDDPLGPRTISAIDPPPVRRVNAIYGINVPTEVSAVFRHRPFIVVGDEQADSRYVLDTECDLDFSDYEGDSSAAGWNWKDYRMSGGLILETKNTPQMTVDNDGTPVERRCCGDGTVPYWNLAHCKEWKVEGDPDNVIQELTVDELEGAGHRGILAEARFHRLLKKYCAVKNERTSRLLMMNKRAGQGAINLMAS